MKKLIKLCEIFLFLLFLVTILFTQSKLSILLSIPLVILLYIFTDKVKIKNYALFIFITALLIRLISIFVLKVDIVDDFRTMLDASRNIMNKDLSFLKTWYYKTYPYQLGHVIYQTILLTIFNTTVFLKIINSVVTSFIALFIYLISKELYKEKTARLISLSYLFYFYPLYLNSVLTNQHIPALITLIIIYLIIKKEDTIKLTVIIAVLLSLANFFRTESIVIILGIVLYKISKITKENIKLKSISIVTLILVYLITNTIFSSLVYLSPLKTKLENNSGLWKFYCGLSYNRNGIYNEEDQNKFFNSNNQKELLIERVKEENIKIPVLFLKKEVILWTQTNYDLRIKNNFNNDLYNLFLKFNQGFLNFILVIFLISLIPFKKQKDELLLLKVLIGLYAGVYMLIEVCPRYAYILHMLLFIMLGVGIEKTIEFINNKRGEVNA